MVEVDLGLAVIGGAVTAFLPPCTVNRHAFVAPRGAVTRLELRGATRPVELVISYPDVAGGPTVTEVLATTALEPGAPVQTVLYVAPRAGEFFIRVRAQTPTDAGSYDFTLSCTDGCGAEATRFPVVLVHGWTGWGNIGSYEYFYDVPETLTAHGYLVHVPVLDPYNSVEIRSAQLAGLLGGYLTASRARQLDLIAHSQGGLDARRAISTLGWGDRVASLVTIATPHQGTPVCDVALGFMPGGGIDVLAFLLNSLGAVGGNESNARASFYSLTEQYVRGEFNPTNPDDPRVHYVSWTGRTCQIWDDCGNVCDVELAVSYEIVKAKAGANDGLIPVSSAPWGTFRGTVTADHFDEIGQLAGATGPSFDHRQFYLQLARDLVAWP